MRFPTWIWRNTEMHGFVEWLREWNADIVKDDGVSTGQVGFYGLDLYSLSTSMHAVIDYLESVDKKMAEVARARYGRLMLWAEDPHEYGLEVLSAGFDSCEREVVNMLCDLLRKRIEYSAIRWDGEEFHSAEQNARLVRGQLVHDHELEHGRMLNIHADMTFMTRRRALL